MSFIAQIMMAVAIKLKWGKCKMTYQKQIDTLCKAIELIREVQNNGLWDALQDPKVELIKIVEYLEKRIK